MLANMAPSVSDKHRPTEARFNCLLTSAGSSRIGIPSLSIGLMKTWWGANAAWRAKMAASDSRVDDPTRSRQKDEGAAFDFEAEFVPLPRSKLCVIDGVERDRNIFQRSENRLRRI